MNSNKLRIFDLDSLGDKVSEMFEEFDGIVKNNVLWIEECIEETKHRHKFGGTTIAVTPKGRPKTRQYMKKRALLLELANERNISPKPKNLTPKPNKSVPYYPPNHFLNKSITPASKKSKITKSVKTGRSKKVKVVPAPRADERADEIPPKAGRGRKNLQPTPPVEGGPSSKLLRSAARNTKAAAADVAGGDVDAKKPTRGNKSGTQAKVEFVPMKPTQKVKSKVPALNRQHRQALEQLAEDFLSSKQPATRGLRSARKKDKPQEILSRREPETAIAADEAKKTTCTSAELKMVAENDGCSSDSFVPEVCNKSLQVSLPSPESSGGSMVNLQPYVKLVDIGVGLKSVVNVSERASSGRSDAARKVAEEYSGTPVNTKHNPRKMPAIYSSTPTNENQSVPVVMLDRLNLTRISTGGSPPCLVTDKSDVFIEADPQTDDVPFVSINNSIPTNPISSAVPTNIPSPAKGSKVTSSINNEISVSGEYASASSSGRPPHMSPSKSLLIKKDPIDRPPLPSLARPPLRSNQFSPANTVPRAIPSSAKKEVIVLDSSASILTISSGSVSKNKMAAKNKAGNSTFTEEVSSYDMTQARPIKKYLPSTEHDYNIRDLESDDSSDDEYRPRKQVPKWATGENLKRAIFQQFSTPLDDVHKMFGSASDHKHLDLNMIFKNSKRKHRLNKRTSSAHWDQPPAKRQGLHLP